MGREQLEDIFVHLMILMAVNANSQFHRGKGLSVYDIELWYRMRGTGNNSGTYHSSNLGGTSDAERFVDGKKNEKSSRRYYDNEESFGEKPEIDYDETIESTTYRDSSETNRRFFHSWEDLLLCDVIDCDESDESKESDESPPSSTSPKPSLSSSSFRPILPTRPSRPRPQPQPKPQETRPQPTPTLGRHLPPTPTSLSNLYTEPFGSILESIPLSINGATISKPEMEHPEIPNGYYQHRYSLNAYKFHMEQVCWFDAQSRCQMESAELAVIENGLQYDIVLGIAKDIIGDAFARFHIGFQRQLATYPWITVYGGNLPFEKWATCIANNTIDNSNCGGFIIGPDYLDGLTSNPCNQNYGFMCEFKIPSSCS